MSDMTAPTPVLIVGAGPSGLVLAAELARRGVPVRVVERREAPSPLSKAIGVFARTLELLEPYGVSERMVAAGVVIRGINLHAGRHRLVRVDTGLVESRYDFVLVLEQSVTERLMTEAAERLGVRIERGVTFNGFVEDENSIRASIVHGDGRTETLTAAYLVGCDGSNSAVRAAAGISFTGRTFEEAFNLADVATAGWPYPNELAVFFSPDGVVFGAPLDATGKVRLILDEPPGSAAETRQAPTLDDVRRAYEARVAYPAARAARFDATSWTSRFTIHRRVVPTTRKGRVLLVGDAAHVHSPAGAQGMNNGIHDAVNLGWKLAAVVQGRARPRLLDTYGAERLPIVKRVLAVTTHVTEVATTRNPVIRAVRNTMMRLVARRRFAQRLVVNAASGIFTGYGRSPISGTGGGGRAPDLPIPAGGRLYDHLRHSEFTLLMFAPGGASAAAGDLAEKLRARLSGDLAVIEIVPTAGTTTGVQQLADRDGAIGRAYGVTGEGAVLVRPDRHILHRQTGFGVAAALAAVDRVLS